MLKVKVDHEIGFRLFKGPKILLNSVIGHTEERWVIIVTLLVHTYNRLLTKMGHLTCSYLTINFLLIWLQHLSTQGLRKSPFQNV